MSLGGAGGGGGVSGLNAKPDTDGQLYPTMSWTSQGFQNILRTVCDYISICWDIITSRSKDASEGWVSTGVTSRRSKWRVINSRKESGMTVKELWMNTIARTWCTCFPSCWSNIIKDLNRKQRPPPSPPYPPFLKGQRKNSVPYVYCTTVSFTSVPNAVHFLYRRKKSLFCLVTLERKQSF